MIDFPQGSVCSRFHYLILSNSATANSIGHFFFRTAGIGFAAKKSQRSVSYCCCQECATFGSQMNCTPTLSVQPEAMLPVRPDMFGVGASFVLFGASFKHRGCVVWSVVQLFCCVQ